MHKLPIFTFFVSHTVLPHAQAPDLYFLCKQHYFTTCKSSRSLLSLSATLFYHMHKPLIFTFFVSHTILPHAQAPDLYFLCQPHYSITSSRSLLSLSATLFHHKLLIFTFHATHTIPSQTPDLNFSCRPNGFICNLKLRFRSALSEIASLYSYI